MDEIEYKGKKYEVVPGQSMFGGVQFCLIPLPTKTPREQLYEDYNEIRWDGLSFDPLPQKESVDAVLKSLTKGIRDRLNDAFIAEGWSGKDFEPDDIPESIVLAALPITKEELDLWDES